VRSDNELHRLTLLNSHKKNRLLLIYRKSRLPGQGLGEQFLLFLFLRVLQFLKHVFVLLPQPPLLPEVRSLLISAVVPQPLDHRIVLLALLQLHPLRLNPRNPVHHLASPQVVPGDLFRAWGTALSSYPLSWISRL
jgi:hypothetical protein